MHDLSAGQRAAVERLGQDVCVVAGPGSGKTRVLIERFAWLVEQQKLEPTRILAITFTEKAANEIRVRLVKRFAGRGDLRESIERAWVSTIDGFCTRLLREHAIQAGLPPEFAVLEQGSADRMLRAAAEGALDELFQDRPVEMRALLEALDLSTQDDGPQPDLAASLIDIYETMRVVGVTSIPMAQPGPDVFQWVNGIAGEILRDPVAPNTSTQRLASVAIRDWAARFRQLPDAPLRREHFEALASFKVNIGHLVKGSASREAANRLKNELLEQLEGSWLQAWYSGLHDLLRTAVARIDAKYAARKRAEAAVDFADLESQAVQLLESDRGLRRGIAARFDQVLMDELQDTNPLQWRLASLLTGEMRRPDRRGVFFGVGDINQSIYGFRHADPDLFRGYRDGILRTGAHVDELRENYRSRPEVLQAVARVLEGEAGIEARTLDARREFAALGEPVVRRIAGQGDDAQEIEAALVAAEIRRLEASGTKLSNIAILVRTTAATVPFEQALERFGIPFLVSGGRTFLEARETRDLMLLLAALVNPQDEVALYGVLRSPMGGFTDAELAGRGREFWQAEFEYRFGRIRRLVGFRPPDLLLAQVLDETGYLASLPPSARANVDKFLARIRREHRAKPVPLAELLEDLEALRVTESEPEAPPPDAAEVVRLMTIHASKGLEFPVVFVSALHRGTDRRRPVIAFSPELGLGAKWRNPVTKKGQSDSVHAALKAELKVRDEAEENRLLYVAMTRAEDRLYLSYAERKRPSAWQKLAEAAVPDGLVSSQLPDSSSYAPLPGTRAEPDLLLDAPPSAGQYDAAASPTDVALFRACPRRYYLGRYLGLDPEPAAPGTGAVATGLEVHRALAGGTVTDPEALSLAARFRESPLGQRAARANLLEREFDFAIEIEDVILSGQIDLWFEEGGELVVVDYKTDRDVSGVGSYEIQLQLYALALQRYAGRVADRAVLYYLRPDRTIDVDVSAAALHLARAAVKDLREAQDRIEFPMNPGLRCLRCPFYQGACPAAAIGPPVASETGLDI